MGTETPGWAKDDLEVLGACPVCAGQSRGRLFSGLIDRLHPERPGSWTLWRCHFCGTGYVDPRPTPATIGRLYERYYTHASEGVDDAGMPGGIRGRVLAAAINRRFGYDIPRALPAGSVLANLLPGGRGMASQHVRDLSAPRPGGRLLDVGCANGAFLRRMRSLGWVVEGFEPDPTSRGLAQAAGISVAATRADLDAMPSDRFDVITMCHVIEHVHDPVALLATCARLLVPGGRLSVATPNMDASGEQYFGAFWAPLDPPRHLVLFTPASLRRAMYAAGFARVERSPVTLQASGWIYPASAALRDGGDEHDPAPLSRSDRRAAWRADLLALGRSATAEEIAVIATTGTVNS